MKKLSEDQQAAYEELVKFLERKNKSLMFCLKGYAGTGKTYLITHFIPRLLVRNLS